MSFFTVIIHIILLIEISKEKNTNLTVLKFKTYNSSFFKIFQNNTEFNSKDFKSFIFSNLYFVLEVGDELSQKNGINQTLNTLIDTQTSTLSLKQIKNDNALCIYNSSLSDTYKLLDIQSFSCQAEEKVKIYSNINLTEYDCISLVFDNYNCLNDSLCGNAGIDILMYSSKQTGFIYQLHKIFNISEQSWTFLFTSEEEGIFIFGDLPHNYLKNTYDENNLISFYSKTTYFEITMDSLIIEDDNSTINDFGDSDDYLNVGISPDIEGIEIGDFYYQFIYKYFFSYIQKNICKTDIIELTITIIYCYADKFTKNDIDKFPRIIFNKLKLDFNITFESNELFYYRDNKYFFKIYKRLGVSKKFILGRIFLKKYLTIFNADKKKIYFYNTKKINEDNSNNNNEEKTFNEWLKIIIIIFLISIIIFLIIGILIGKVLYKKRKKHANELDDEYIYKANTNNKIESLYGLNGEDN